MSIRATVIAVLLALIAALSFSVYYYHDAYSDTNEDLKAAARKQQQAETIAGNVIQSMRIFNAITRANTDEKQQIQQWSENNVVYIREKLSTDECVSRPVPDDVVIKLREHADRIRNGTHRADPR
ncbi:MULTISPECIES: hypothetical protein [Symbiopectobacterium]|uniref:hypothetical protein n=1 Tax=Symbiopectobacterium TaxID=801 RepID=UPI001A25B6B4|nr:MULTISPECIES: hypothetical protein [Symbiopectobacterium]MBG6247014.1 hypothetical protein [Candidatus Symbiopectobacterium sp. PLON1]MBT9429085.1 hypothetical protein [Candidatus Symbiopectobacterium endolongispinus]